MMLLQFQCIIRAILATVPARASTFVATYYRAADLRCCSKSKGFARTLPQGIVDYVADIQPGQLVKEK
jgi:hypothetical protein